MVRSHQRVINALARAGVVASKDGPIYRVRRAGSPHAPDAEILLPEGFPLESKAVEQLVSFASVRHPAGGEVRAAFATPNFHPGSTVPVGAVVATTRDMVIPQAIGTDIQCGMRLHVTDLSINRFVAGNEELVALLKGDLLLGTRDPLHGELAREYLVAMNSASNYASVNRLLLGVYWFGVNMTAGGSGIRNEMVVIVARIMRPLAGSEATKAASLGSRSELGIPRGPDSRRTTGLEVGRCDVTNGTV